MKNTPKDPYTDRNTVAKTNERTALRNELREKAKHARAEMPAPYRAHKSAELCKQLIESLQITLGVTNTNPKNAVVGVYSAFHEEVDLQDFIKHAYSMGCAIAFPCMVRDAWSADKATCQISIHAANETTPSTTCQNQIPQQTMEMRIVSADAYARSVEISSLDCDLLLSDNYFDLNADEKEVEILSGDPKEIKLRSVYQIR